MSLSIGKKIALFLFGAVFLPMAAVVFFTSCTFDYSDATESEKNKPDTIMEELEYVRVRGGDPLARFRSEYAERWEDNQTMQLKNFTFEQMQDHGETINAEGNAAEATVKLDSGDITLSGGVRINIKSEDIIITTGGLEWKDKEKNLTCDNEGKVDIERTDGTVFSGSGFSADIRSRTWNFSGEVSGRYVEKDNKDKNPDNAAAETPEQSLASETPSSETPHPSPVVTPQAAPSAVKQPAPAEKYVPAAPDAAVRPSEAPKKHETLPNSPPAEEK